jgi:hypothetical protein
MLNEHFVKEIKEKNSEGYTFRIGLRNGSNGNPESTNSGVPTISILQDHRRT